MIEYNIVSFSISVFLNEIRKVSSMIRMTLSVEIESLILLEIFFKLMYQSYKNDIDLDHFLKDFLLKYSKRRI